MLFRRLLITFFLISGSFSVLYAREIAIHVEDADLEMALEGAHVYTWDGRDIICNAEGNARLLVPDSETVMVRISYPGYRTERVLIPPSRIGRLTVSMRIESLLENKELVFTAEKKHEGTEVTTGRSVALAGRELSRTSEIGFIEDVMTAVKLLPGVGYSGMFNAMPSIRGGEPGDLIAAFDGFYIDFPYFWGGGMSIFDPHMIQSVKLSHGIFSTRYGHTISGLLELTSKKPSSTEIEVELGISTSALNLNVSVPINRKGGFMVMGKVTYWDGYLALIKALANVVDEFKDANAITTAPYIRVAAFNGSYRFTNAFELSLNGFIGGDGVAAEYNNQLVINGITQDINSAFIWDNLQGFLIAGTTYNPRSSMVVKTTLGSGFTKMLIYGDLHDDLHLTNSPQFIADMISQYPLLPASMFPADYRLNQHDFITNDTVTYTGQGRVDYDWDMGKGFLFAAGVQELYTHWTRYIFLSGPTEKPPPNSYPPLNLNNDVYIDIEASSEDRASANHAFTTAAYSLLEYKSPEQKFGAELGLRLDHLYFIGKDFTIQTIPAFNPRLNIDINIMKNKGFIDLFNVTAGTGFFSSLTESLANLRSADGIDDYELKQNRSFTSLVGTKITFLDKWSFNIEGYYKHIYNRAYYINYVDSNMVRQVDYLFDGQGRVWGFDFILQKMESRFVDGWISYTYSHARYLNPLMVDREGRIFEGSWRYPNFHRFHNLNLVLNLKPSRRTNIGVRFGYASGTPLSVPGQIEPHPVLVVRPSETFFIQKYKRQTYYSETRRNGFALPLDIKLSFFSFTKAGKTQGEVYIAVENTLSFLKTREKNTTFNEYTGVEVEGSDTASYQMPVPMISFGFTWSY